MKAFLPAAVLLFLLGMPSASFGNHVSEAEWEKNAEIVVSHFDTNRRNNDFLRAYNEYIQKIVGLYEETSNNWHERKFAVMIYMNAQLAKQYAQDHFGEVSLETRAEADRLANVGTYLVRKHDLVGPPLREDRAIFRRTLSAYPKLHLRG